MDTEPIVLIENATGQFVDAVLHFRFPEDRVRATEVIWKPYRDALGNQIEHGHWDWERKANLLHSPTTRCLAVECAGRVEGMMMIEEVGHRARLPHHYDTPLVYVDYLESAPWNVRLTDHPPMLSGVGVHLMKAVVTISRDTGDHGRVGLHSLRRAEGFYESGCRMLAVGQDPRYNGLMYYEFTAEAAEQFLLRRGAT